MNNTHDELEQLQEQNRELLGALESIGHYTLTGQEAGRIARNALTQTAAPTDAEIRADELRQQGKDDGS